MAAGKVLLLIRAIFYSQRVSNNELQNSAHSLRQVRLSIRPRVTIQELLTGFFLNFVRAGFTEIRWNIPVLVIAGHH